MKIKINREGLLWIERKGVMKEQICPYCSSAIWSGTSVVRAKCGDWCPLFVEPSFHKADDVVDFDNVEIALCRIIHNVPAADFEDER